MADSASTSTGGSTAVATSLAATPLRQHSRGLAHALVEQLSGRIRDGAIQPGARLPTEATIVREFGVSRTVVREALSQLQAAGLVETRHGIGTFVLQPRASTTFRLDPSEIAATVDVLAVLELRISLETEAAALAATRRTAPQLQAMRTALDAFAQAVSHANDDTVSHDLRFHLGIAEATGNPYFGSVMQYLGETLLPRTRVRSISQHAQRDKYLQQIHQEHEHIYDAIARHDADAARTAMQTHLTNSRERLQQARAAAQDSTPRPGTAALTR